jgi:signal transduction histidine kinase
VRLAVWYGALLTVALVLFIVTIFVLNSDLLNQTIDAGIRAESRVATLAIRQELSPEPPYWPARLTLPTVTEYHEPGVGVEVKNAAGQVLYRSGGTAMQMLPPLGDLETRALQGETAWATLRADGMRVRIEALPVRAPVGGSSTTTTGDGAPTGSGPVIGTLVTVKSLADVDAALQLFRIVLLLAGIGTLLAALAGGWLIAGRVLHPVAEISDTARTIATQAGRGMSVTGLRRRVHRPGGDDELARMVDTFNEMLASLDRAIRTQHRFVADASHELRAPLTTVQGNLAFLQRHLEELPPEERKTMLADAHSETLRLARLVDDLLMLARADVVPGQISGADTSVEAALPGKAEVVELDHELIRLVRQLRGRLAAEGNQVRIELGLIEPARVHGDVETLRRIALILLDNAIKYTPVDHGAKGPVVLSLERSGQEVVLRVRDHGIGIEPADLPHVFERFYRADKARMRQGTGLGLSIAETLVDQLEGRISAESTPGEGSTFSVWLPLA